MSEIKAYVSWENNQKNHHLLAPMRSPDSKVELVTVESVINFFRSNPARQEATYIIWHEGAPIGQINYQMDPPHLLKKQAKTCWIGLVIGDSSYWGSGASTIAMKQFEVLAGQKGFMKSWVIRKSVE